MRYLSDEDLRKFSPAESATLDTPIPTQMISNGEFTPLPQTPDQRRVEQEIGRLAEELAPKHGMNRRQFLSSSAGMSAAFLAMNSVFGPLFTASKAEAATPGVAEDRARKLAGQFIFDCQTHFVRDDYGQAAITGLAQFAKQFWNPALQNEKSVDRMKFANYVKEIYVDSDTKVALLSGSPVDDEFNLFLTNDQIAAARTSVNTVARSRRMLAHSIIQPMNDGWLDEVDRCIEVIKPDSWKGYTIGDPIFLTKKGSNWRLDDEKRVYPFYEKCVKSGITTVCVHKGLMPADYEKSWPEVWKNATVWDLGKAAKDWPQINFVIYHSAYRFAGGGRAEQGLAQFEQTGRVEWVSDLAEIPAQYGVTNVYGDLGQIFAQSTVVEPRLCAAMMGILIKGLGADHVVWGTDAIWTGSPQWQIEALRRLEIPEDMQRRYGFTPLGPADGPVKTAIFGGNSARMYRYDRRRAGLDTDAVSRAKADYALNGPGRSNLAYGYVAAG
jgi:predicted TIM-barrel fold metal-dependent hydrolase